MKTLLTIIVSGILYAFPYTEIHGQVNVDSLRTVFSDRITEKMKKKNIVGVSLTVVSADSVVWKDQFGYADKMASKSVTDETLFGLGSVTKVFTTLASLQLMEADLLSLDDPLKKHLPSFSIHGENSDQVTIRNIITHHSGLPSDEFKNMFNEQPVDYRSTLNYIKADYMAGRPNEIRAYSNAGYSLLGQALSEIAYKDYEQLIEDSILRPLNMNSSGFKLLSSASRTYDKKAQYSQEYYLRDLPAGGLFSSTKDMTPFAQSFLNQSTSLLEPSSNSILYSEQHSSSELNFNNRYGLGLSMHDKPYAGTVYSHSGTTLNFNSILIIAPEIGISVVLLTNSANGDYLFHEAHTIVESIAQSMGREKVETTFQTLGTREKMRLSSDQLENFEGNYGIPGALITVRKKKKNLNMKLQGLKVVLMPVSEKSFMPKILLFGFIPIRMAKARFNFEKIGGYDLMTLSEKGSPKEMVAKKMNSLPVTGPWIARIGEYEIDEVSLGERPFFKQFELSTKNGSLVITMTEITGNQKLTLPLEIIDNHRAVSAGLGRYAGQSLIGSGKELNIFGLKLIKK